jgi:hypothetical protein
MPSQGRNCFNLKGGGEEEEVWGEGAAVEVFRWTYWNDFFVWSTKEQVAMGKWLIRLCVGLVSPLCLSR